ncbi:hypothetical protein DFJ43DRAFT_1045811 [Lentinula guzmanii]|uniref:Nephrocystin 3-like N-terminal domain-containing protein n=1 Tax=Lentinula guzmanii TaxID=2804957 RepID=A0AA38N5X2_9AGAR|nr:hypothetical protein DFJ43DRAFT_1045811 [Lentinula guzmanii]
MARIVQTFTSLLRSLSSRKNVLEVEDIVHDSIDFIQASQQQPPSPKTRAIPGTISGCAKLLLDLLGCVSDYIPLAGLGAMVSGLQALFEQYEKLDQNNTDIEDLHHNLERLIQHIRDLKDDIPESLKKFLNVHLAPDITIVTNDIKIEIENLKKPTKFSKYFSAAHDSKAIADLAKRVNSMFTDIMAQLQRTTFRVTIDNKMKIDTMAPQVDASRRQRMLHLFYRSLDSNRKIMFRGLVVVNDKLIKAPNALPDNFGRKACLSGTRSGVLKRIEDWIKDNTTPQIFCLSGASGTGKTAIAVSICQQMVEISTDLQFAGFFCSSTFDDASNPKHIFPTLAGQLASRNNTIYSVLEPTLMKQDPTHGSGKTQFEKLLVEPLNSANGTTLLVVDGLDECRSFREALEVLTSLSENVSKIPSLKLLICCCSDSPIFSKISEYPSGYHRYSLDDVCMPELRHDLRLLLAVELKSRGFDQGNIISLCDVINNAHCSFFAALTACEELSLSLDSSKQVEVFKNLLSRGMNNIYESLIRRALSNVNDGDPDELFPKGLYAALTIVAFGKNSLELPGLSKLLEIPIDHLGAFFSGFSENILSIHNETILIHHSSFQDYLKDGTLVQTDDPSLRDCIHLYITEVLFRTMNFYLHRHISGSGGFRTRSPDLYDLRQPIGNDNKITPTLSYACCYWAEHLAMIVREDTRSLFSTLQEFFRRHLLHWLEVLAALGDLERVPSIFTILLDWIENYCDPTLDELLSFKSLICDAQASFALCRTAMESSPHQVYHSFLLPWTPSGRRLAETYRHVEASIAIAEVSCHRRQMLAIEPVNDEPMIIKLSHDATRVAVVRESCIAIGENVKGFEVFLNDAKSQSYIDACFVGKDHILVTTLSCSGYAEIHLWNVVLKKIEKTLLQQYQATESKLLPVLALLSENGKSPSLVAVLTSSRVRVWEVQTWREQLSIQCRKDQDPGHMLLALSSHHILIGLRLRGFPRKTKTVYLDFTETPRCASFTFDGDTLAIAGDTVIALYSHVLDNNASRISPTSVLSITRSITSLVFSPREPYLVATGKSFLWAWNILEDQQPLMRLRNEEKQTVSSVVFSDDGRFLHCAHICPGSRTALFDMRIMEEPLSAQMPVTAVAMSCSGKIATGSNNGAVAIWNSSMTHVLRYWKRERHPSAVISISFSKDGKFIASISPERVYIRSTNSDFGSDEIAQRLTVQSLPDSNSRFLRPCAFSRDASLFVCIIEADTPPRSVQIWKMASWNLLGGFELNSQDYSPGEEIQSISLSQEGDRFVIKCKSNTLAVYTLTYNNSSIHIENIQRIRVSGRPPLHLDDNHILSTAGTDEQGLNSVAEIPLADAFLQDGWIVDPEGRQRCWIPFREDICDWASYRSLLVICTKTLGNVILVSVRSLQ